MKSLMITQLVILAVVAIGCESRYESGGTEKVNAAGAAGAPSSSVGGGSSLGGTAGAAGESGLDGGGTGGGTGGSGTSGGECVDQSCVECQDACATGDSACSDGSFRVCEPGLSGCLVWSAPVRCSGPGVCADDENCAKCDHECSLGDSDCDAGMISSCSEDDDGCRVWSNPVACESGTCEGENACSGCDDECSANERSCATGALTTCELDEQGCYKSASAPCDSGQCVDDSTCFVCNDECQSGDVDCQGGQLRTCEVDSDGCWSWSAPTACSTGDCQSATACGVCDDKCVDQATTCSNGTLRTCVADSRGCLDWSGGSACASGWCADVTACGNCNNQCTSSATQCTSGQLRTCQADGMGCLAWSAPSSCATGTCANSSSCFVCNHKCSLGSFDCNGSVLRECVADSMGCRDWSTVRTCNGRNPICMAAQGRCGCDTNAPVACVDNDTPEACINGTWTNQANCTGVTPKCVAGQGCVGCTENSDCPQSGCHFLGPDQGACFDVADVYNVSNSTQLMSTVTNLGSNAQAVVKIASGNYDIEPFTIQNGQEVSLIGTGKGSVYITRSVSSIIPNTMSLSFDSYLYLSKMTIADGAGTRAVGSSQGSSVWIEDFRTYGYSGGVGGPGDKYIRRSQITGTSMAIWAGGDLLRVENSFLGPGASIGIYFSSTTSTVDLRYVTVAGNTLSMECWQPYPNGSVRNSILVGNGNSIQGANASACLNALSFIDNAVDQANYGAQVGAYQAGWFANPSQQDFHLSASGSTTFANVADWDEGDPLVDYDGDARPTSSRGRAGADEP